MDNLCLLILDIGLGIGIDIDIDYTLCSDCLFVPATLFIGMFLLVLSYMIITLTLHKIYVYNIYTVYNVHNVYSIY